MDKTLLETEIHKMYLREIGCKLAQCSMSIDRMIQDTVIGEQFSDALVHEIKLADAQLQKLLREIK